MEIQVKEMIQVVNSNTCILPVDIFNAFNLSSDVMYNIHFGQLNQYAYILPGKTEATSMFFSKLVFKELALFEDIKLNIKNINKDIYLGPVVGVFVTQVFFNKISEGNRHFYAGQHICGGFAENCFVYYFSMENINWAQKKIYGYTILPSTEQGKKLWMPMPDILYDRAVGHNAEERPKADQVRKQFRNGYHIQCINNRNSLGKWQLYKALSKHPQVKKYIPETKRYTSFKDAILMLKQYEFIFLKSFYGSCGKEVLSIGKEDNRFKLNFYDNGLKIMTFDDIAKVEDFINNFTQGKKFIVQQGVRLLDFQGRKFDIRMLLQKDENGLWRSNLNACRIAKEKLNITNISAGGELATYEEIYPSLSVNEGKVPSGDELVDAAVSLAIYIEKEFGAHGEIGMDMAIDVYGNIWFIEANARPDKFLNPTIVDAFGGSWLKSLNSRYTDSKVIFPHAASIFKYAKLLFEKCF
jgi:hypothetical protein